MIIPILTSILTPSHPCPSTGDQGKLQHLQHELDGTARQLRDSLSRSTKLEGKVGAAHDHDGGEDEEDDGTSGRKE